MIHYASGHRDHIEVAMRRAVLTGVNKSTGELQLARAEEMGCDLVETTAHAGARPEHMLWQGNIFSRSGSHEKYPDFVSSTGYGKAEGLCGINCHHNFHPFFEGLSEPVYSDAELEEMEHETVTYNGEEMSLYDATQKQRAIERKIRHWKRREEALKAADLDTTRETEKVKAWQAQMRDFTKQTGLHRQYERERIPRKDRKS